MEQISHRSNPQARERSLRWLAAAAAARRYPGLLSPVVRPPWHCAAAGDRATLFARLGRRPSADVRAATSGAIRYAGIHI